MRVLLLLALAYALTGCATAERYQMEAARAQAHAQLVQADTQLAISAVETCGENAWCAMVQVQAARDGRVPLPHVYEHPGWELANTIAGGIFRVGETWIRIDGDTRQTIGLARELRAFQGAHTDNRVITNVGGDQVGRDLHNDRSTTTTTTAGGDIAGRDHAVDASTVIGRDQYQDSTNAGGDMVAGDKYTDSCSSGDECYNASPDQSEYTDSGTRDNDYSDNRQYSEQEQPPATP